MLSPAHEHSVLSRVCVLSSVPPVCTQPPVTMDEAAITRVLRDVVEHATGAAPAASAAPVLDHIVKLVAPLLATSNFDDSTWDQVRYQAPPTHSRHARVECMLRCIKSMLTELDLPLSLSCT